MIGIVRLAELAKKLGVKCRTLRDIIRQLERKHQIEILSRASPNSHFMVDLAALYKAEPSVFAHVKLRSIEATELHSRIDSLETRIERIE